MEKISLSHGVLFCKRSNDTQKWQPEGNEETDEKYVSNADESDRDDKSEDKQKND